MTNKQIDEALDNIIDKYWHDEEEYYSRYRYETVDDREVEFDAQNEIEEFLRTNDIDFVSVNEDGFDSCGYSNDFYAVSYVTKTPTGEIELGLTTVVWECM